jgi:hypothetical protein
VRRTELCDLTGESCGAVVVVRMEELRTTGDPRKEIDMTGLWIFYLLAALDWLLGAAVLWEIR